MADTKITDLTALTIPVSADVLPIVDDTDTTTKKITFANFQSNLSITASQVSDFDTEVANNSAVALNTAKTTNATHTGDVTGGGVLTAQPALITGKDAATVATGDLVLIADINDSNNLKKVTAESISLLSSPLQKIAYKSADQTVNNSIIFVDDEYLTISVGANEVYAFSLYFMVISGTTPDFQCEFSIPSGATIKYVIDDYMFGSIYDEVGAENSTDGGEEGTSFTGVIINGANAGSMTFRWTQRTQHASDTKVLKGSYIIATKLN